MIEDISSEKRMKSTMSRYMDPGIANQLLEDGADIMGGQDTTATLLFSDLRSFTNITESLGAQGTVKLLNEYFEIMEKYLGNDEANLIDFSPVFNADKMKTRILMWHGQQDQIAPIVHMDLMKDALEEEGIEYQSFTMSRLGHEYGEAEDMKVHLPVMKKFILGEL